MISHFCQRVNFLDNLGQVFILLQIRSKYYSNGYYFLLKQFNIEMELGKPWPPCM